MQIDLNKLWAKHPSPISSICEPRSKSTTSIPFRLALSPAKHDSPRLLTEEGIKIDVRQQCRKHRFPIRASREAASNLIISMLEPAKQASARTSTKGGIEIDFSELSRKQLISIRLNRDPDSIVNLLIFSLAKQDFPRVSTDRGMHSDFNEHL
jgi:hypothetical protein